MKNRLKYLTLILVFCLTLSFGLVLAGCFGKVTLTFDAGEGTPVESIEAEIGSAVDLPLSLRKGYVLSGWSTQKEGGPLFSGSMTAPESDTTYYAVWTEGHEVVFDSADGVYAEGAPDPLTLAAGANLYAAVDAIRPSKTGLIFGAWFWGDVEITNGFKMPDQDITLTAKYKVEYAVETYLCNLAGNAYVRSGEVSYASDYVGATVSPAAPAVTGFLPTSAPAGATPVSTITLSAEAAQNVLKFYYDRRTCQILFDGDAVGATGSVDSVGALYESTVELPQNAFAYEGYRFAGWSSFSGGDVDYLPGQPFAVMGDTVLYAVWDKGYTNRFGGSDLLFFPRLEQTTAVLRRGNMEFSGTRSDNAFSFTTPAGTLEGAVYGATFSYRRDDLVGTYTYYANTIDPDFPEEDLYDENRTIRIDEYFNATYRNGSHTCDGAVAFDEEFGDYVFTSGDESFHFLPAQGEQYAYDRVFSVGGPEVGSYIDFVMIDTDTGMGYAGYNMVLIFDGYGTVMLGDMTTYLTYDGRYYVERVYPMGAAELYRIVCYISDPDGELTGEAGAIATNYIYTVPLGDPDFDGYVEANSFRGEYTDGKGNTLVLDGFGLFADSAQYASGDTELSGSYTLSTDLLSGSVVTVATEQGGARSFRVNPTDYTFSEVMSPASGGYAEYRFMDGNTLHPPFLVLYDEDVKNGGEILGKKTEIYVPSEDESELIKIADGYCVSEAIGAHSRFSLYTFVRTGVTQGYETVAGEKLVFYNSIVTSTVDYMSYNVYCLLEETVNGETVSYKETYSVAGGGEILVCSSVTAGGLGALYIDRGGNVTEGQFSLGKDEHFDGTIGTFIYATEQGELPELYFDISQKDDGSFVATPREGVEQMLYVVQPTGVEAGGVGNVMIFLDGVSRMKFTENQGANFLEGNYEPVSSTRFGETVYAFTVRGEERFRFVIYTLPEYEGVPLAVRYDGELAKELGGGEDGFSFTGVGSLTLDGYHSATLDLGDGAVLFGNYYRDLLLRTIYFTASDGTEYVLELDPSEKTFTQIDWAAGRSWRLRDNNYELINGYYAFFSDDLTQKTVRIETESGTLISEGAYVTLGYSNATWGHEEYLLRGVTLGPGYPEGNYRVTFAVNSEGEGACLVYNPETSGVFTDENWNVLVLDGFGSGEYFTETISGSGTYEVIDFSRNFIIFTVDDALAAAGETFYFRVEKDAFYTINYEECSGVFFSDKMESIVFGADGTAYFGAKDGPYFVQDGKAYVYLDDNPTVADAPAGDTYTFGGAVYHRWMGEALTLKGTVRMLGKDMQPSADHPDLTATLTFTPNRTTNQNRPVTFTFEGEEYLGEDGKPKQYTGYSLSLYPSGDSLMSETARDFSPTIAYGNNRYAISFTYQNGEYGFTVTAGYNSVEYLDHNARYYPDASEVTVPRGGRLYKNFFGFGAIEYEKPTLSGDFLYLFKQGDPVYGEPLHFEDVPEASVKTVGYDPAYGNRLELTFTANDGEQYLLNYYEYYQGGNYFWCYGFFSYREVEAEAYNVRVKTLLYTKMSIAPGYSDAQNGSGKAIGQISAVTLFDKETGAPVVAYDTGITPAGYNNGVWIVDKADVLEHGTTGTCTWGKGYLVTFTYEGDEIAAAEVTRYDFVQVVNYMQHLVNLFFDEAGNATLAAMLVYNGEFGRYEFVSDPHDFTKNQDGTFSFSATWDGQEYRYTVKWETSDNVTFRDGEGNSVEKPGYTVTVTATAA